MKLKTFTSSLFISLIIASVVYAGNNKGVSVTATSSANKIQTGCADGNAQSELNINNVRTTILTDGDMWWNLSGAKYEIPNGSGLHSMFCGALWIGGTDIAGNIKIAAQTYRQTGNDFWPGAVDTSTVDISPSRCTHYDKHWKITKADVLNFIAGGSATPDMISYPGNGDIAFNEDQFLAPFFDANADGIYNTANGDYPNYNLNSGSPGNCNNYLFGTQTLWWVFNDLGNVHTETGGDAIGLEIRAQAFAYPTINDLNNTTFYKYEIINRSPITLENCYFGQWADPDLGNAIDDYVGCHVTKGLGYCYNGDADDNGTSGYGLNPPAIGIDFLQGPLADPNDSIDNDKDGTIDEPGEQIIMSKFVYYNNINNSPQGNPTGASHFYYYLKGIWGDGQGITYGGNGASGTVPCDYMFPDNTDSALNAQYGPWSEVTVGNVPEDRRFLMSAGKFTLQPGAVNYITTGVLWARATTGGPLASVNLLFTADSLVQELFDSCFVLTAGIEETELIQTNVGPNPFSTTTSITFKNDDKEIFTLGVFDIKGKLVRLIGSINSNKVIIEKGDLAKGVYIYKLESNSNKKATGKLIIE